MNELERIEANVKSLAAPASDKPGKGLRNFGKNWESHAKVESLDHHFEHLKAHRAAQKQCEADHKECERQLRVKIKDGASPEELEVLRGKSAIHQHKAHQHDAWHAKHLGHIHGMLDEVSGG
jgi:hypothetical protein